MTWKEIVVWIGGIGTVLTVIITMLWGVPHYITVQVAKEVAAINSGAGKPSEVVTLEAQMEAVNASLVRIEKKQDDFGNIFTAYLTRQSQ